MNPMRKKQKSVSCYLEDRSVYYRPRMNKPCLFTVISNENDQLLPNWDNLSETDRGILNPRLPVLAFVLFSFGSERLHWKQSKAIKSQSCLVVVIS